MYRRAPIKMNYQELPQEEIVEVDVYTFYVNEDPNIRALCWFPKDRSWRTVPITSLTPLDQKQKLDE